MQAGEWKEALVLPRLAAPQSLVRRHGDRLAHRVWAEEMVSEEKKKDGRVQSRAARSRDLAIHMACDLLQQSSEVWRVIGPDGVVIERAELEAHYDEGRFPGLRRAAQPLR
jgi:hypothetical protein